MARLSEILSKEQVPPTGQTAAESVVKNRGALHGPFSMAMTVNVYELEAAQGDGGAEMSA